MEGKHEPPKGAIRIVTGGQTGVDRAALDAALTCGLAVGGWCPAGRRTEDGPLDARYPLRETPSSAYAQRTQWNVRDSDATLVLAPDAPSRGTALTVETAGVLGKPLLQIDPMGEAPERVCAWLRAQEVRTLNVAGPREAEAPGVYAAARDWLERLFRLLVTSGGGPA